MEHERYLDLPNGVELRLLLGYWRPGSLYGREGLTFDILWEDGRTVRRTVTVVSQKLLWLLRPVLESAENDYVAVGILREGEGVFVRYSVRVLPPRSLGGYCDDR